MADKANLAWSLISGDGSRPLHCGYNDQDVLQLKGIFMTLDSSNIGILTLPQVVTAFNLVGQTTSPEILAPYFDDGNGGSVHGMDFDSFVQILWAEKKSTRVIKEQMDDLFSFIDNKNTGKVTVRELQQLLSADASPFQFSKQDFLSLLASLGCEGYGLEQSLDIATLKQKLIFGIA